MANISQNSTYDTGSISIPKKKYTPSSVYKNLAQIKSSRTSPFSPAPLAMPGTPEYSTAKQAGVLEYGRGLNKGMGVSTQQSFLPPIGDLNTPISIPSDYSPFRDPDTINENGQNLSWGTPKSPVIRNIGGDTQGQYVEDTSNPDMLVKTERGNNALNDLAMKNGRPGFMYQIDHIMPLSLGGADTLANRQLLTSKQNDEKTKAQAVPYTLYAHGDISLSEARAMAMQWKNRDITDLPQPNSIGLVSDVDGRSGIEIARDVSKRWTQPKEKTFKESMGNFAQATKDFGKGWLPDSVREFVKGVGSGASLGFVPYEQGENQDKIDWLSGKAGQLIGGVGAFMTGEALLGGALRVAGLAKSAIGAYRGASTIAAAESGFNVAKGAEAIAGAVAPAKAAGTTFKTLNSAPSYFQKLLTPQILKTSGKLATTGALVGQGSQLVQTSLNADVLSGKEYEKDQDSVMKNIFTDAALGAISGIGTPTIKGTAYAATSAMTMAYIGNPDDPMNALVDGVAFAALHAHSSRKTDGYNNVKMFGGSPYKNPTVKAFDNAVNEASYASLSHYAPHVLPPIESGAGVPKTAHNAKTIQKAKDAAIENVWRRFFFGKDITVEAKTGILKGFKSFSKNIETNVLPEVAPLSGFEKLSRSARKDKNALNKNKDAILAEQFGPGYQTRNRVPKNMPEVPAEGMDLQAALTEIKRITVASRQLYKGGLSGELRNKADVDDLLSFSKNNLKGRVDTMNNFGNPPVAKDVIDIADESFMQKSFNNEKVQDSGNFKSGDMALTGAALDKKSSDYFFDQKEKGNASPNIILVDRSDTAPVWRMKNRLLNPDDVTTKKYAEDPNPENALQAFGVVYSTNPATGARTGNKELVPLGWVASDFRLNTATGEGHKAFNQHPSVLKYQETNGAEGFKPLELHKDQVAPVMKKNGLTVLVANLDPRATKSTVQSKNPFIPVNVNESNWNYSKQLAERLSQRENSDPVTMDISKVLNSSDSQQRSLAISEMQKKIVQPVTSYIPEPTAKVNPKEDRITIPQETTREVLDAEINALNSPNPMSLRESFKRDFGIDIPETEATDIFNRKNDITMRDGVKILVDAVNEGNANESTKIKMRFVKTYLESGALKVSDTGKVLPDMKMVGGIKADATTKTTESTTSIGLDNKKYDITDLSKQYIPEALSVIDEAKLPGRGYNASGAESVDAATKGYSDVHDSVIRDTMSKIQSDLQSRNIPQDIIDKVKTETSSELKNKSNLILGTSSELSADQSIPKPKFVGREFYDTIETGLKNTDNIEANFFAKSLDEGLKKIIGPNYRKDKYLPKILADYFRDIFFSSSNAAGRELTQPKGLFEARALGNFGKEKQALSERNKVVAENAPTDEMSPVEKSQFGFQSPEDLYGIEKSALSGMTVKPQYQEENMVHDLTKGEDLMGAIFADIPQGAVTTVRAVKKLFIGGSGHPGLKEFIEARHPSIKKSYLNFNKLEKDALSADSEVNIKKEKDLSMKSDISKAKIELSDLGKRKDRIIKDMEYDPENPPPTWQTPELMQSQLDEVNSRISEIQSRFNIEPTSDGEGGLGDWLSSTWSNTVKPALQKTAQNVGTSALSSWKSTIKPAIVSTAQASGNGISNKWNTVAQPKVNKAVSSTRKKLQNSLGGGSVTSAFNKGGLIFTGKNDISKYKFPQKSINVPKPISLSDYQFGRNPINIKTTDQNTIAPMKDENINTKPIPKTKVQPKIPSVDISKIKIHTPETNKLIVAQKGRELFGDAQVGPLLELVQKESGFRHNVKNAAGSSAYGMFQFLDGTWGSYGGKKTDDPVEQTRLGLEYIKKRYGTPENALRFWMHEAPSKTGTNWY